MLSAIYEENENEICNVLGLKWLQMFYKTVWSLQNLVLALSPSILRVGRAEERILHVDARAFGCLTRAVI